MLRAGRVHDPKHGYGKELSVDEIILIAPPPSYVPTDTSTESYDRF